MEEIEPFAFFQEIENLKSSHEVKVGDVMYAISNKWFARLKLSAKRKDESFNLKINNKRMEENGALRIGLIRDKDYVVIPQSVEDFIKQNFEIDAEIKLPVIQNVQTKKPEVIESPPVFNIMYGENSTQFSFSLFLTFKELKSTI